MKHSFLSISSACLAFVVSLTVIAMPQAKAQTPKRSVAFNVAPSAETELAKPFVTINREVRTKAQAELLLREQSQRGEPNGPQLQAGVRDVLINLTLMAQAATKAGLDKLPLVQAQIELARQNTLAQAWQETVLRDAPVDEAALKAEYERQVQALGPEELLIRHLLVAEEATARLLVEKLQAGAPMATLAAEYSRDEATRQQGGLLPWTPQGELLPIIAEALKSLTKGQSAGPVQGPSGWHVLQLEDRRPYQAPAMEQVRTQLLRAVRQQLLQKKLSELQAVSKID